MKTIQPLQDCVYVNEVFGLKCLSSVGYREGDRREAEEKEADKETQSADQRACVIILEKGWMNAPIHTQICLEAPDNNDDSDHDDDELTFHSVIMIKAERNYQRTISRKQKSSFDAFFLFLSLSGSIVCYRNKPQASKK